MFRSKSKHYSDIMSKRYLLYITTTRCYYLLILPPCCLVCGFTVIPVPSAFFPPSVFVHWGLSQWQGNALSGDSCLWLVGLTPWAKLHCHWSCNHPCPCAHDSYSYCQGIYSSCLSEKDAVFDFSSSYCGSGIHSRDFSLFMMHICTCNIMLLAQRD